VSGGGEGREGKKRVGGERLAGKDAVGWRKREGTGKGRDKEGNGRRGEEGRNEVTGGSLFEGKSTCN